jgi:purine-cytosine permease-like protein
METEQNQNWAHIAALYIGGAVSLPVIMAGYTLAKQYGLLAALLSIILGNIFLLIPGLIISHIGIKLRIPTVSVAAKLFGQKGLALFSLVMLIIMTGWSALQLDFMSSLLKNLLNNFGLFCPQIIIISALGILLTLCTQRGLKVMGILAGILTPILVIILIAALYKTQVSQILQCAIPSLNSIIIGIPLIISATIALIVDLPTYVRTLPTFKETTKLLLLTLLVGMPLVQGIGGLLACSPSPTLINNLMSGNIIWSFLITLCFILSGLIANMANIYSAAISLEATAPRISLQKYILITGALVILITSISPVEHFTFTLELIGTVTSGLGALMICWFFTGMRTVPLFISIVSLLVGCSLGILNLTGLFTITQDALIDTALVSGILYTLGALLTKTKNKTQENTNG